MNAECPRYANRAMKNARTKYKTPCRCLTCLKPEREEFEGLKMLVCSDEACFMNCDTCTDRPITTYCYVAELEVMSG